MQMRDKIVGFILALYPVICIYKMPGIDLPLGMVVMYLIVMPLVISGLQKRYMGGSLTKNYVVFTVYAILITVLLRGINNDVIGLILNSICIFILLRGGRYIKPFLTAYVYLAVAFSVFLMVQYVGLLAFSKPIEGILSFLPTMIGDEVSSLRTYDYMTVARIASVFTEPSHYSLYSIPPLALLLWNYVSVKHRVWYIGIITVAILLSTSGNGVILMLILYALFFLNRLHGKHAILAVAIALALIPVAFKVSEKVESLQYTLEALSGDMGSDNSKTYYRVSRGFMVYGDLPPFAQVMGVGYRNSENFLQSHAQNILQKYREGDVTFDYYNSIAAILIYFGFIGFILMTIFISSVWRSTKQYGEKALLVIMIISCASSSVFNTDTWFMYILLMTAMSNSYLINQENYEKREYKQNTKAYIK